MTLQTFITYVFCKRRFLRKVSVHHLILQLHCLQELKLKGSKFFKEYQNIVIVSPFLVFLYIVIFNHVKTQNGYEIDGI
jgi:hypothetical protein